MKIERIEIDASSLGTVRTLDVYRFGAPGARPKVYVQAAIHADEQPASLVASFLIRQLEQLEAAGRIKGEIVVTPVANPIGLGQVTLGRHEGRCDIRTGSNFNREFPDLAPAIAERLRSTDASDASLVSRVRELAMERLGEWRPYGELSALRKAMMLLAIDSDLVIDLHTGHGRGVLHMFISQRDWPALMELAEDLACDAVYWHAPFPRNSTFTASVGALWARLGELRPDLRIPQGCQALVLECRGQDEYDPATSERDAANLIKHLARRGVVVHEVPASGGVAPRFCGSVDCIEIGYAPTPGTLFFSREVGEEVREGETICTIVNATRPLASEFMVEVRARSSGILLTRLADGQICWPNRMIFSVAGLTSVPPQPGMVDMRS